MAEIRYAGLHESPPFLRSTGQGTQPGPPSGDGWSILTTLPQSAMPAGAGQYALLVTGKVGDMLVAGTGMLRGMTQVCLGTTAGLRHPRFRASQTVLQAFPSYRGIAFQFLVLISSAFPDSILGSSFDPSGSELCLWGRTYLNGDPQTYYTEFTVADVKWLWWDVGAIPSGHWSADRVDTSVNLPATNPGSFTRVAPAASGGDGQQWLHFWNVWYEPRVSGAPAPAFRFGVTPDGTFGALQTLIGSAGRWGQNRFPAVGVLDELPNFQQGGFAVHTNVGAGTKPGYMAFGNNGSARVHRYHHFGVRIDTLPDVLTRSEVGPLAAGLPVTGNWQSVSISRERPAAGILTQPIVMVHQVPKFQTQASGYGTRVTETDQQQAVFGDTVCFPITDPVYNEGTSSIAIGRRTFQTDSPAMQWHCHLVGDSTSSPQVQEVQDFCFVCFHPVRDPENLTTPPGSLPSPILLVPGSQSPDVGSLIDPPFVPNAETLSRGVDDRQQIRGITGYRRRWPVGAKALRAFSVTWGPLEESQALAVFAFLVANPAWRYTPPKGPAVAVLSTTRPEMTPASHRTFTVAVDIAVLVWTGGP